MIHNLTVEVLKLLKENIGQKLQGTDAGKLF